jgi:hypothetical protein
VGQIPAGIAAAAFTGWGMDKLAIRSAKKNGGKHTPEARLPIIILPSIVGVISTVIYGFSATYPAKYGWAGIVVTNSTFGFAFVSSLIFVTTFGVEVCPQAAGPAIVIAVGLKNVVAFAVSFGVTDLIHHAKGTISYGILAGIFGGVSLLAIPVYFLNPKWREWTSGRVRE